MVENLRIDNVYSAVSFDRHKFAVIQHSKVIEREMQLRKEKGNHAALEESMIQDWQNSLKSWYDVFIDDTYWAKLEERATELSKNDPRLKVSAVKAIRDGLPTAILGINAKLAADDLRLGFTTRAAQHLNLGVCSGFPLSAVEDAYRHLFDPIKEEIKEIFKDTNEKLNKKDSDTKQIHQDLCNKVQPLLDKMAIVDPTNLLPAETIKDEFCNIIRSAAIAYTNATNDSMTGSLMLQKALEVASSSSTRQRINDDLKTCRSLLTQGFEVDSSYDPTRCWYCGEGSARTENGKIVQMHKILGNRYWNLDLKIPRCSACNDQHKLKSSSMGLGVMLYFFLAVVGSVVLGWWVLTLAIFFPLTWVVAWGLYRGILYARMNSYSGKHKVKTAQLDGKFKDCPLYQAARKDGFVNGKFNPNQGSR